VRNAEQNFNPFDLSDTRMYQSLSGILRDAPDISDIFNAIPLRDRRNKSA